MSGQLPLSVQELQRRAVEHMRQGNAEAALALLDGVPTSSSSVDLRLLRGDVLAALKRFDEAIGAYRQVHTLDANNVRALSSEGSTLLRLGQLDGALASFERALALAPHVPGTWYNRGHAHAARNRIAEALADFTKAIEVSGDYAVAHINRGMMLLLSGRYREGFAEFEWRFNAEPGSRELRNYRQPRWRKGNAIADKRIRLYTEQGMGDVIQFARFVPQVVADAAEVTLEVQPALVRLLQSLPCAVIAFGSDGAPFNLHSPLVSLGYLLDVQVETIPARVAYLTAPAEDVARWRAKLGSLGAKLKVGLVWSGNPQHNNDFNRSIPFAEMATLFDVPNVAFVSLQKDVRDGDAASFERGVLNAGPELGDFADTAGLIENLDLVITADTSVAHLAGALGKTVWVLLPFAPDWRWMLERSDSPWYPSATLFRQKAPGDWASVLREVKRALEKLASPR